MTKWRPQEAEPFVCLEFKWSFVSMNFILHYEEHVVRKSQETTIFKNYGFVPTEKCDRNYGILASAKSDNAAGSTLVWRGRKQTRREKSKRRLNVTYSHLA